MYSPRIYAVILAAGKGKRMKSDMPKVLHVIDGKPLIDWVLDTVTEVGISNIVIVVGYRRQQIMRHLESRASIANIRFTIQERLLGTADAVKCALPELPAEGTVFVLCGDVPLIKAQTLNNLLHFHIDTEAAATILTANPKNPEGYGRIVRTQDDSVMKIVEHRDATQEELKIGEVNSGTYVFDIKRLKEAIDLVEDTNDQSEYYLTDVIHIMRQKGYRISAKMVDDPWEVEGVNSRIQMDAMERHLISGE